MKKIIALTFTACMMLVFASSSMAQQPTDVKTKTKVNTVVKQKVAPQTLTPAETVTPAATTTTPTATDPEGETPKKTKVRTRAISIDEEGVSEDAQDKSTTPGTTQRVAEPKKVKTVPK